MLRFGFDFTSEVERGVEEEVLVVLLVALVPVDCREMQEDSYSSVLVLVLDPECRGMNVNDEVRVEDRVVDSYDDSCRSFVVDDDLFVFLAAWRGMNKEERAGEVPVPVRVVDDCVDSYDDSSGFVVDDSFVVLSLLPLHVSELFSGLESEEVGDE
jgi:hypothetical protein